MADIVLSADQTQVLRRTDQPVTVVDANGFVVGLLSRGHFTKEQIEEAERRIDSGGPWYTTAEVLEYLRSLDPQ